MRRRVGPDRLWTIPNALSCIRLVLLAGFISVLAVAGNRYLAFSMLAIAGVTDFLDGFIARHFDQVSNFGKLLDPIVDRVVLAGAIISMTTYGAVPVWLSVVVLVREGLLLLAGVGLSTQGVREMEVLPIGKAGTFGMMFAFPTFLLADGPGHAEAFFRAIAWIEVVPSLLLSWAAAFAYVPIACRAVIEHRNALIETNAR